MEPRYGDSDTPLSLHRDDVYAVQRSIPRSFHVAAAAAKERSIDREILSRNGNLPPSSRYTRFPLPVDLLPPRTRVPLRLSIKVGHGPIYGALSTSYSANRPCNKLDGLVARRARTCARRSGRLRIL